MTKLVSIGLAEPPYVYEQRELKEFVSREFAGCSPLVRKTMAVFDTAQIERRHFINEMQWYGVEHSFTERNSRFIGSAPALASAAMTSCMENAGAEPDEIDHVVFVTTTGISTPTIDALLFNMHGLRPDAKRTPLWGLGCLGGAVGISRARDYTLAFPKSSVLVIALETCSLAFQLYDHTQRNVIASALFSDGAAAALVVGGEHRLYNLPGARLLDSLSTTYPDSIGVMGWDIVETGFKVVMAKDIPSIVKENVRGGVMALLAQNGYSIDDINLYASHPGGVKVLSAYEDALGISASETADSRRVLREHGNMSSPTVLFVLNEIMSASGEPAGGGGGGLGLISSFGPGFGSELILFDLR